MNTRRKVTGLISFTALALLLAGCDDDKTENAVGATGGNNPSGEGGSTDGGGGKANVGGNADGGTTLTAWEQYCKALTEREATCDPHYPPSPSYETCAASEACAQEIINPAALGPLQSCLTERSCDEVDDACYADETNAAPEYADYKTACASKVTECGPSMSEDFCTAAVASSAVLSDLSACLESDCDAINDCVRGVVDEFASCDAF